MKKFTLFAIAILTFFSIMAQNSASMKLNLEKNKVYRFRSVSEQNISQTINGVAQNTSAKSKSVISLKMLDANTEFMIIEVRFDTIESVTNAMGITSTISSDKAGDIKSSEASDVMTCIFNRLSKNALYVKMAYTGKVIEIVNSKMLSEIIMKDTALITGLQAPMIKIQIKNSFGDKALKSMVEGITGNLPEKPDVAGDKWNNTISTDAGGMSLDVISNYKLNGVKGNEAGILVESTIKASDNAAPLDYGMAKVTYGELKGMGKSNLQLDTRTGLIISSSGKTHIAGNLIISAQGMNMQMPMEMDVESKVSAF